MVIGLCVMELLISEAGSLKDKRRILKSVLDRVKAQHNVSIAEVEQQDNWQSSTIALTSVANERKHAFRVVSSVVKFFERQGDLQVLDYRIEML